MGRASQRLGCGQPHPNPSLKKGGVALIWKAPIHHDLNLTADRPTFVTHLACSLTGERYEADRLHGLSAAGKPLLVRYDLDGVRAALDMARERLSHLAQKAEQTDGGPVRRAMHNLRFAVQQRLEKEGADTRTMFDVAALIDEAVAKIERL